MITLGAVFNAAQQRHWCIADDVIVERHRVQVLDRDPAEDRSRLFHVRCALANQHAHKVSERFLVLLRNLQVNH